jgi:hypothetical protein
MHWHIRRTAGFGANARLGLREARQRPRGERGIQPMMVWPGGTDVCRHDD